ncbi:MAG: 50S ribosome-binding GTPase [Proteobacteria bacterium]|nr:50S ribosome-binding GTPase [Pseudomonadota bacterium]
MVNILDQSEVDALLKGVVKGEIETEADELITELKTEKVKQKVSSIKGSPFSAAFHPVYDEMKSAGVSPVLAKNLIEKCAGYLNKKGRKIKTVSEAKEVLALAIIDVVKVSGPVLMDREAPEVPRKIAFVGPTGVGKTTTMAKLAGEYSLKRKKIAFITIDTCRIAAVEQLKIYAKILKVPVEVATSPRELKEKLDFFNDKDLVFIDTGGISQKDFSQLSVLKQFFQHDDKTVELHLLMSATTKGSDLVDIIECFSELPIKRFLFTKLDESTNYGSILNVAVKYKLPYSYFATGQKVPEDIEVATSERVADMILRISQTGTRDLTT